MRTMRFAKHTFQRCVNGREATIVAHLKHATRITRLLEYSLRVGYVRGEWLLAKDVFACFDRSHCQRDVLRVWSGDIDGVAFFEELECGSNGGGVVCSGQLYSCLPVN